MEDRFRNPNSAIRNRTTILNVDDDDASRYAVSHILHQAGFEVIEAASGAEVLRLVRENPDLVILDVNLPDISGLEVCRRIKADPATSLMPVLMLSATYRDDQARVKGLESGADGYLTHPVEPQVLISTVKAFLRIQQAEAELQAAAREWRTTFDAIGDAVCLLDGEGRMLRCNEAMTNLLGKPFDEIIGHTCWELVHGTSEPIAGCPVVRMRESRRRETLVLPMGDRWVEVSADPLLDETGDLIGSVHIMADITERKRAEEAIREGEERFRRLYERAPLGYQSLDAEGCFIDVNQAWQDLLGYSRDQVSGRWFGDFLAPQEVDSFKERFPRFKASGEVHVDVEMVQRAGSTIIVHIDGRIGHDKHGQFKQTHCILHDITERKRAEETIQRQLAEIASYYDNAPIGLAVLDTNLRYLRINDRLAEINGIPAAAHIGKTVKEIAPALEAQAQEVTAEILRTGQPVTDIEFSGETAAQPGVNRSWLESWHPLKGENGNITGFAVMVLEITKRKQAEEERKRLLAELEAKNRELESFVYTVSHDLKAPLVSLHGFSSTLQKEFYHQLSDEGRHYLERIQANAAHMDTLIMDLLELSRIGRVVGPIEEMDVAALLGEIQEELAVKLEEAGAEFVVQEPLPTIRVDRGRIHQVFTNLIDNAIKFRSEERPLRIKVGCQEERGFYRFHVADNGIGIAPQYHEQIFAPFQQLDAETEGVGMGLALVKKIVEHHGGRVWVESEAEKGATFYFTIPIS
jgi:PAS domain S-box-containing protein